MEVTKKRVVKEGAASAASPPSPRSVGGKSIGEPPAGYALRAWSQDLPGLPLPLTAVTSSRYDRTQLHISLLYVILL